MKRSLAILAVGVLVAGGCAGGGLMGGAMGSAVLLGADAAISTATSTVFKSREDREREKAIMNTLVEQKKTAKEWRSRMPKGSLTSQEDPSTETTEGHQNPQ
jgi:hypothetical protein